MEGTKIAEEEKEGKGKIPFVLDKVVLDKESSGIYSIIKKGDILLLDFSAKGENGERVLLFSIKRKGERVPLKNDDKLFLGIFSDEKDAKLFAFQTILLIESILGVRMSFSLKKETIVAVIS